MTNNCSTGAHDFALNEVVMYQRFIRCMVVDFEADGSVVLRAYDPDMKVYGGIPFSASRYGCDRAIVLDRTMMIAGGGIECGPPTQAHRDLIDRVIDLGD